MKSGTIDRLRVRPRVFGSAVVSALFFLYKGLISPLLVAGMGPACRFAPSCSEYAAQAVGNYGITRGGWMAVKRLLRCRPGGGWGYDPVTHRNLRH